MNQIERLLLRAPRRKEIQSGDLVLAHYTTYQALISIAQKKELWATSIHYLNDELEYKHGFQIFRDVVRESIDNNKENVAEILEVLDDCISRLSKVYIHVVSFSEDADRLSQWRGYTPNGGVSIDFSFRHLQELCENISSKIWKVGKDETKVAFQLLPCVYSIEKKKEICNIFVEDSFYKIGIPASMAELDRFTWKIVSAFSLYASLFKHDGFEEEKEWRLVSGPIDCRHENIEFYATASLLRPYFKFDLKVANKVIGRFGDIGIRSVTISPTVRHELMRESVNLLFEKYNVFSEYPDKSKIPYRTF